MITTPEQSQLIKKSPYIDQYCPDLLYPILRQNNRDKIGLHAHATLPFFGFDCWNHYEVSWLNEKGKPVVAIAEILIGADSLNIIESKSMKLYFNALNNTTFKNLESVKKCIHDDLAVHLHTTLLIVNLTPLADFIATPLLPRFNGTSLDQLDITCSEYHANPAFLLTETDLVEESVCSDLLKSNCLVTNQPDWGSIQIHYVGKKINHEGLLRYIVSFRNDNEFHEHCIEKIFVHLMHYCQPKELTVIGRSTRRGGIDINSSRSTKLITPDEVANVRLCRQ